MLQKALGYATKAHEGQFRKTKDIPMITQSWYFTNVANNSFTGLKEEEIPHFFHSYKQLVKSFFV